MYTIIRQFSVPTGYADEFEAGNDRIIELLKRQPGFVSAVLANNMGDPNHYGLISTWQDRAAYMTYFRSPALRGLLAQGDQSLAGRLTNLGARAYERVCVSETQADVHYLVGVSWTVDAAKITAFEASRQELFEQIKRQAPSGWRRSALSRYLGAPGQYLVGHSFESEEAAKSLPAHPVLQQFQREHPATDYTSVAPVFLMSEAVRIVAPVASA